MGDISPLMANGQTKDGAQMYLCPVFHGWTPGFGSACLGAGLSAVGYRVMGRVAGGPRQVDDFIADHALKGFIERLPEPLAGQVRTQHRFLSAGRSALSFPGYAERPFTRPLVMGVVNVTPDSFSDGGDHADEAAAVKFAMQLVAAGADILDIGGESTRPGAEPVWEGEELDRVIPVIHALKDCGVPLSVDTRKASVMEAALDAGAVMINDVSAFTYDPDSLYAAAKTSGPVVLMHAQGDPRTMQDNPGYKDVALDVYDMLADRIDACIEAGILRERIILDPGLGFGKRVVEDNLALVRNLSLFHTLGCPLMLGASRKRFLGAITGEEDPKERGAATLALTAIAVQQGVHIHRVHDVKAVKDCTSVVQAIADSALMDGPHKALAW